MYGPWTPNDDGDLAPWYVFLVLGLFCLYTAFGVLHALRDRLEKPEDRVGYHEDLKGYALGFVFCWGLMALLIWNPELPQL